MLVGVSDPWAVPRALQIAAEEVREHLCALRGGALFLSSSDAALLVGWLESGISVTDILRAMERAREARRKKRSKSPLTLGHVKRHLGRPTSGVFARERPPRGQEPPFTPVARALKAMPTAGPAQDSLVEQLLSIQITEASGGSEAVRTALATVRVFLDARWSDMGDDGRRTRREQATAELGDLLGMVDEATANALVEETARDLLHKEYPCLSAASLWELVGDDG